MPNRFMTRYYALHGSHIAISANHAEILDMLHARLRVFATPRPSAQTTLRFTFTSLAQGQPHPIECPAGQTRTVFEAPLGQVLYAESEGQLFVTYGTNVRARCCPAQGQAWVSVQMLKAEDLWLACHAVFTILLLEMLKWRNCYAVHAAGLLHNGKGLLFPGASGAGKSTLTLALLRAGFGFLADDTIFLREHHGSLRILAFPDELDLTDDTVRLFPELNHLLDVPKKAGAPKHQVWVDRVYSVDIIRECSPSHLIFPRVAHQQRSVLTPMDPDEALLALAPNVWLTDAKSSQGHFDLLAELVRQSQCYHLETGYDLDSLPLRLSELVESN